MLSLNTYLVSLTYTDLVWVVSSILRMAVCLLFIHLEGCVVKAQVEVEVVMPQYKSINEPKNRENSC